MTSFPIIQAATHKSFRFSSCLSLNSYRNQFPAFWTSPKLCKRLLTAISVTFNVWNNCLRVWEWSSSSNASKSSSSNVFGCPGRSLSSRSKSPLVNRLNQSLHVISDIACSADAFWSKRWLLAALFMKLKQKKQSFLYILFGWFKVWHFRCYKKCNVYKWIHSRIENCMASTLIQYSFSDTSVKIILVTPSLIKQRVLSWTQTNPIFSCR